MKFHWRSGGLALMMWSVVSNAAAPTEPAVRLTGIVRFNRMTPSGAVVRRAALLEISEVSPGRPPTVRRPILQEGEREETCEVLAIDEKSGKVTLRTGSNQAMELKLDLRPGDDLADRSLNLQSADLLQVLEIYQELAERTVLRPSTLTLIRVDLKSGPALTNPEAAAMLAQVLTDNGMLLKPCENRFVFLVPADQAKRLSTLPDPPASEPGEEVSEPGLIKFTEAGLLQVLAIYQDLAGRTVLRSPGLRDAKISVRSETRMTRKDAVWMLDVLLSLSNVTMATEGARFVFAVPVGEERKLSTLPKPPASEPEPGEQVFAPGLIKFTETGLLQVLEVYQELAGRTILRPTSLGNTQISVRSQTSLTRKEAVWMFDVLLSLANVAMVPESAKFVFAVHSSQANALPKFDLAGANAKIRNTLPPGTMKFQEAAVTELLNAYATLVGRTPLPIDNLPMTRFSINTQKALDQAEAIFALEALATLNNLKLELVGDSEVTLIPASQAGTISR